MPERRISPIVYLASALVVTGLCGALGIYADRNWSVAARGKQDKTNPQLQQLLENLATTPEPTSTPLPPPTPWPTPQLNTNDQWEGRTSIGCAEVGPPPNGLLNAFWYASEDPNRPLEGEIHLCNPDGTYCGTIPFEQFNQKQVPQWKLCVIKTPSSK